MAVPSVAMIGSFRKHLTEMEAAKQIFTNNGIEVVNPLSTEPLQPGIEFVRFATDGEGLTDAEVQIHALERILGATAVYVICPEGYTGKTTAYEWGWVSEKGRPAYFSDMPSEWFMQIYAQERRVVTPQALADLLLANAVEPLPYLGPSGK